MEWRSLTEAGQIQKIKELSNAGYVLIFKHSNRCSISSVALNRIESKWNLTPEQVTPFMLNVVSHRDLSQQVALEFGVRHESPQVLLIKNGICIEDTSHLSISYNGITAVIDS